MGTTRALVLGGGGVAGIAWETGVLAGRVAAGFQWQAADLIVGTSAGASVAAQLTSGESTTALFESQVMGASGVEPVIGANFAAVFGEAALVQSSASSPAAGRRAVAAMAVRADRVPESERRSLIERRIRTQEWPRARLQIAAVAVSTGDLAVFTADSGVPLVDAVAASCAIPFVWPAVTIDGERYIDGGIRSMTNEDLARGYDRVLVLEPMAGPAGADVGPLEPPTEVVRLRPDAESIGALADPLNPASGPGAAQAGRRQGSQIAVEVISFWAGCQTPRGP